MSFYDIYLNLSKNSVLIVSEKWNWYTYIIHFLYVFFNWIGTGSYNPSSLEIGIYLSYTFNIITADDLATQGARASAAMVLTSWKTKTYLSHTSYTKYHACWWWPGDARSQGISSHGIISMDLALPDYSNIITVKVSYIGIDIYDVFSLQISNCKLPPFPLWSNCMNRYIIHVFSPVLA